MIRIETGTFVAVIIAIIGGAVYIGHLQGQINTLNPNSIQKAKEEALIEIRKQKEKSIAELEAKQRNDTAEELQKLRAELETRTRNITSSKDGRTTIISLGAKRKVYFQSDGNLVIYRVGDDGKAREALWNSRTVARE